MRIKLTIKNYRCFVRPTTIDISKGFTAFVGINNAGKSTIMRFLLEFRKLFQMVSNDGNFINSLKNGARFEPIHVLDNQEIFSNLNQNKIEFCFDFFTEPGDETELWVDRANFTIGRDMLWKTTLESKGRIMNFGSGIGINEHGVLIDSGVSKAQLSNLFKTALVLSKTLYIGPFRNTINVGTNSDYLDIQIGESFIKQFSSLKLGAAKKDSTAISKLTEDIKNIFDFDQLDIAPSSDNKSLHITVNGKPYKQHELGSGLQQFILVLANAYIRQTEIILIDEPELNLHPALQLDFLTTLGKHARHGVWFSTHGIGLARSVAERIYSVTRQGDGDSIVSMLESTPRLSEFLGEMSFSSHQELGFEKVLLVEGATEVKVFQVILRAMKKDHKILLLPLYGRINPNIADELDEILRISPNISALIDSERIAADKELAKDRQGFLDLCKQKNITARALEYRATENYFPDEVIKNVFGEKHRALQPYEKLDEIQPHWNKNENWKLAAEMSLEQIKKTDMGQFLESL